MLGAFVTMLEQGRRAAVGRDDTRCDANLGPARMHTHTHRTSPLQMRSWQCTAMNAQISLITCTHLEDKHCYAYACQQARQDALQVVVSKYAYDSSLQVICGSI